MQEDPSSTIPGTVACQKGSRFTFSGTPFFQDDRIPSTDDVLFLPQLQYVTANYTKKYSTWVGNNFLNRFGDELSGEYRRLQ